MKIDTLILSGASTRGVIYFGCLDYLIENNLMDKDFKNIKKILCVSASYLFILTVLLLNYDYEYIKQEIFKFDFNECLDINDLSLKSFIDDYGFINYNKVENDLYSYELNDKLIKILNKYKISLRDPKYNSFNDSASIEIVINIIRFNKIVNLYNKNNCYLT